MANRHRLVMKSGPDKGASFELASALVSIGRYAGNTIAVPDEQVSRHHARLTRTEEGFRIEDLSSVNGLFVNDQRVSAPRFLVTGDEVRLGKDIIFHYETFTEYDAIPAFAGIEPAPGGTVEPAGPDHFVSDKGATVYQKAVELPHSRVVTGGGAASRVPWAWVMLVGGALIVGALITVIASAVR